MRLFEVEDRFTDDLITILRNLVGRSDSKHSPQSITYQALANMLKNLGYGEIDYDQFKGIYDNNPDLQAVIKNFNADGIELNTDIEKEKPPSTPVPVPKGPSVDSMAHSGAADYQKTL